MRRRRVQGSLGLLLLGAIGGFASCREPTQIKVIVTTDADCPEGDKRPRLNDVVILTGKEIVLGQPGSPKPAPAVNAETELCSGSGDTKTIGSLVLLPGDGDGSTVDVMIAAGVQRDESDDESSAQAGFCASRAFNGESIEGLPCIIARRRVTFIDHNSLVLPIELDRRCIGEDCGSDLTCYQGNCVDPSVDCAEDAEACALPEGCPDECENDCSSGGAECVDGVCSCFIECDPDECVGNPDCDPATSIGLCNDNGTDCGCAELCDPVGCAAQGGTCMNAECIKECEGTDPCVCDDLQCATSCEDGMCSCVEPCSEDLCDCVEPWQIPGCPSTCEPCMCSCEDAPCVAHCSNRGLAPVGCIDDQCVCDEMPGTGGGGAGEGGAGGTPSTGGMGGTLSNGGGGASSVGGGGANAGGDGGGPNPSCPAVFMDPCDTVMCPLACGPTCTGMCVGNVAPDPGPDPIPVPNASCVCTRL